MLVLTRKTDQSITLGDPTSAEAAIEVTVIEIRGDQVRLGIQAPGAVAVHRKEIWEQVQGNGTFLENRPAASAPASTAG